MSKLHTVFLVIVILFNVLMCYGFVSSKTSLEDFLRSEVNGHKSASWIYFGEPFKIGVGHPIYEPWNPGPLPTYTADYTYVLVLVSAIGNVMLSILFVIVDIIVERKRENLN